MAGHVSFTDLKYQINPLQKGLCF